MLSYLGSKMESGKNYTTRDNYTPFVKGWIQVIRHVWPTVRGPWYIWLVNSGQHHKSCSYKPSVSECYYHYKINAHVKHYKRDHSTDAAMWTLITAQSSYANAVLGIVILSVRLSVCPSATTVFCDELKEHTAKILTSHKRVINLVFWQQTRLVGDVPFHLKIAPKVTHTGQMS